MGQENRVSWLGACLQGAWSTPSCQLASPFTAGTTSIFAFAFFGTLHRVHPFRRLSVRLGMLQKPNRPHLLLPPLNRRPPTARRWPTGHSGILNNAIGNQSWTCGNAGTLMSLADHLARANCSGPSACALPPRQRHAAASWRQTGKTTHTMGATLPCSLPHSARTRPSQKGARWPVSRASPARFRMELDN